MIRKYWPVILRLASIVLPIWAVVTAAIGVGMYVTAGSQPELREERYVPGEQIEIPNAYRWDGMVLWGNPTDIDLSEVTCSAVFPNREEELAIGPRDGDEELATYSDPTHGEVVYLASTADLLFRPNTASCDGDGLDQILISADRDLEGSKADGNLFMIIAAMSLVFGLTAYLYSRSLNGSHRQSPEIG